MYLQKIENYQGEKMKTIHINSRQLKKYKKLKLSKDIPNTESIIYEMSDNKLLKVLFIKERESLASKLYTVSLLSDYEEKINIKELVIPQELVSIDGLVSGFTIPYIKGENLGEILKNPKVQTKTKIDLLKKIGLFIHKLEKSHAGNINFNFGDLHPYNILVNKEGLHFIDLDSSYLGTGYPQPGFYVSVSKELEKLPKKYNQTEKGIVIPNDNTDLYCYNMMILEFIAKEKIYRLKEEELYDYLEYLREVGYCDRLLDSFQRLYTKANNINPYECIDTLDDKLLGRGMYKVYEYLKNKPIVK